MKFSTLSRVLRYIVGEPSLGRNLDLGYNNFNSNNLFEDGWGSNEDGEEEVRLFLKKDVFVNPKPTKLIQKLTTSVRDNNMLILDFFAGSGTTGHAVMKLNAADKGNRKFILVQLPESIDPKKNKVAYDFVKDELKKDPTIFEITKERLIKAATKIKKENHDYQGDLGFKSYEIRAPFDGYFDIIKSLEDNTQIPTLDTLTDNDIKSLLLTWVVQDGKPINATIETVDFDCYHGYLVAEVLYLMDANFDSKSLKALIGKLDNVTTFNPKKLVIFGYRFVSKEIRESLEGLKSYKNKKSIELEIVVRY